ncbi:MAG: hypothetical protein OXU94_01595 [Gammaproteobacteria bacterium]|nr:hypothetical protein [Gammaproteobacteria bacterium]
MDLQAGGTEVAVAVVAGGGEGEGAGGLDLRGGVWRGGEEQRGEDGEEYAAN